MPHSTWTRPVHRFSLLAIRPLGFALGLLILLNLVLALENPRSSATRVWLDLPLPEPALSIFAALLGLVLLLPHRVAGSPRIRWILGGVVCGFAFLAAANVVAYYHRLYTGSFRTAFPVPFSCLILLVLVSEFARIFWWVPAPSTLPPPARVFVRTMVVSLAFLILISAHVVTFGSTDHRRTASAAVVLGAKVYEDGSLSEALRDRVDTGVRLYRQKLVDFLIMTGGVGANGISEPERMAAYAIAHGVPPGRIILDEGGNNTFASARNCGEIARRYGFGELLTVSQDWHCARIKLIFERAGTPCFTVPAAKGENAPIVRPSFFLFREILAYPFYFIYHS
ncbi:MAG TPA: YdcF family protein [Planctomycetota bacterium]|nr:YdcF family protein [Planctomycetota bacterium]